MSVDDVQVGKVRDRGVHTPDAPRILLVDDQPARLLTYESVLQGVGVQCVRANSGQEALAKLLRESFALILLDVSMPEMDGFETARLIREHPRFEKTPIIFVTGIHISELDRLKGYESGAIDYIEVPIVPEILRSKVALLVELYRRRAELEALNLDLEAARRELEIERRGEVAQEQAKLAASEARYRAIFENPMAFTVVIKAVRNGNGEVCDWEYLDANQHAIKLLGLEREGLIGRKLVALLPDRASRVMPMCAKVLEDQQPHVYETQAGGSDFLMCLYPMAEDTLVSSGVDITSRIAAEGETKRMLASDRAEKEWLNALLKSMNEEVYFTDTNRRYSYANPAATRQFGSEIEGIKVEDVVAKLDVFRLDGSVLPLEEAPPLRSLRGETVNQEEQLVRIPRTGEMRHRQVSSAPVRSATGEIIGAVSVVRDVTEQRRVDEDLRLRDSRSRALLRLADRFRSLRDPAQLALEAAEIIGTTLGADRCGYGSVDPNIDVISIQYDWCAPGIAAVSGTFNFREHGSYIDHLKRGETVICEDVRTDPRTAPYAERLEAFGARSMVNMPLMEHGALAAVLYLARTAPHVWSGDELAFVREVLERTRTAVERRRVEQAIQADLKNTRQLRDLAARIVAEDQVQSLFEEILAAAVTIAHADGGTLQLLDEQTQELHFAAIHGLDPELTGHFERVSANSHTPCGQALAQGVRIFSNFEVPADQDPDGSFRLHVAHGLRSAQSTPLVGRTGRTLGMFSTHWRARHRPSEQELRHLDLLARQAADFIERNEADKALRTSAQQLREADKRKDEFIAVLAHELRNPLVPIRAGVELLKKLREQPQLVDTVRPLMERQIGHMVRLIDDLLDVSRITSGKIELRREPVALSSLVGNALDANREAISAGNLELTVNLADPDLTLHVDPTRFSQIISNLLQNAAKFTPSGGKISVTSAIEPAQAGNTELVIRVIDTGVGIAESSLGRIFELFEQGTGHGQARHAGLGIGLALARRLAELHGGTLNAVSAGINQGSEFVFKIPAPGNSSGQTFAAATDNVLQNMTVLVIDDNRDGADMMAILVEDSGAGARVAYDGPNGLAAAEQHRPNIVLLDIGMPGMDGYEVCRRLRARFGASIGIVALSGWGQEQDKRMAAQAGFDAHLTKPADPGVLAETIRSIFARLAPQSGQ